MPYILTVTHPFGNRRVGERITDQNEVDALLSSDKRHAVVRSYVAEPAPEPAPEPALEPPATEAEAPGDEADPAAV